MMCNRQHLNQPIDFAVNKVKVKNLKHGTSNVRGKNNP